MPRGRQYYDPIVQVPGKVDGTQDLSRVEVFQDDDLKWWGREVAPDGSLTGNHVEDFDHDRVIARASEVFPGLPVYELRSGSEDSTWEGHGPSPRLWQVPGAVATEIPPAVEAAPQPTEEQAPLHLLVAPQPGAYVLLGDVLRLLEMWAVSYEVDKNPSGALALREAADALKDIG
jgi:hypothetical protein